eukprot:4225270-Pyramimonas_sp.AAC.1
MALVSACNLCGALRLAELEVVDFTAREIAPPAHPHLGLQNPRGSDCDECSALAGASLRPHLLARACSRAQRPASAARPTRTQWRWPLGKSQRAIRCESA